MEAATTKCQPLLDLAQKREDTFAVTNWIQAVKIETLSYSIMRIDGVDFEGVDFIQENEARTTYENGLKIKEWLTENNYEKIYLVTSAIHMRRSKGVFDNIGVNFIPVVSNYAYSHNLSWLDYLPNRGSLRANMQAVHEWVGLIWYKINNRI
jgi:uncharacterized SAM-binding protein YcdF (DUF218 family)